MPRFKLSPLLMFRCAAALAVGTAIVAAFVALLSLYGISPQPAVETAARTLPFPENEEMLDTLTAGLAKNNEIPGGALQDIEPAAGEAKK